MREASLFKCQVECVRLQVDDGDGTARIDDLELTSPHSSRHSALAEDIKSPRAGSAAAEPRRDESRRSSAGRPSSRSSFERQASRSSQQQDRPTSVASSRRPESASSHRSADGSKPATPVVDAVVLDSGLRSPDRDTLRSSERGGSDSERVRSP